MLFHFAWASLPAPLTGGFSTRLIQGGHVFQGDMGIVLYHPDLACKRRLDSDTSCFVESQVLAKAKLDGLPAEEVELLEKSLSQCRNNIEELRKSCDQQIFESADGFEIRNFGLSTKSKLNRVARPKKDLGPRRVYRLFAADFKQGTSYILVQDITGNRASTDQYSRFILFPRRQQLVFRATEKTLNFTMVNGEDRMIFDRETKQLVGGSFREGAVRPCRQRPCGAAVKYQGSHVIVRMDGLAVQSRFPPLRGSQASILKAGHPSCEVEASEIWNFEEDLFRFSDDKSFNEYLKPRCGFAL